MSLAKYLCSGALFCALGVGGTLLTVKGCDGREVAPPVPEPVVIDVQAAAADSYLAYGKRLGNDHRTTAEKLRKGAFKSWAEVKVDHVARTKESRDASFKPLSDAMNGTIGGEFDAIKGAEQYEAAAKGFPQ